MSKSLIHTVAKHKIYVNIPYIGVQSEKLQSDLRNLLSTYYPQIQTCFYFKNNFTIGSFFKRHDSPDVLLRSCVIYKYECHCCQQCYIGSSSLQMFRRVAQHRGVSFRTNRPLNKVDFSSIREHCHEKDHRFQIDNFSILSTCNSKNDLKLLESIYIHNEKPSLNRNKLATPLHMVS